MGETSYSLKNQIYEHIRDLKKETNYCLSLHCMTQAFLQGRPYFVSLAHDTLAGLNSELSIETICFMMVREPSLSYYLPIAGERR